MAHRLDRISLGKVSSYLNRPYHGTPCFVGAAFSLAGAIVAGDEGTRSVGMRSNLQAMSMFIQAGNLPGAKLGDRNPTICPDVALAGGEILGPPLINPSARDAGVN